MPQRIRRKARSLKKRPAIVVEAVHPSSAVALHSILEGGLTIEKMSGNIMS